MWGFTTSNWLKLSQSMKGNKQRKTAAKKKLRYELVFVYSTSLMQKTSTRLKENIIHQNLRGGEERAKAVFVVIALAILTVHVASASQSITATRL